MSMNIALQGRGETNIHDWHNVWRWPHVFARSCWELGCRDFPHAMDCKAV